MKWLVKRSPRMDEKRSEGNTKRDMRGVEVREYQTLNMNM